MRLSRLLIAIQMLTENQDLFGREKSSIIISYEDNNKSASADKQASVASTKWRQRMKISNKSLIPRPFEICYAYTNDVLEEVT